MKNHEAYDAGCSGKFFLQRNRAKQFGSTVRNVYRTRTWRVFPYRKILDSPIILAEFCRDVFRHLLEIFKPDQVGREKLDYYRIDTLHLPYPNDSYSFVQYVGKRLELLAKSSMLSSGCQPDRKKLKRDKPRERSVTGGAVILELF